MPQAYSYLRFSSPQQAEGDSVRRQTRDRENWLAAHPDIELDRALVMTDAGRSAFKRKRWDTYALARFVECIKSGRVEPGSYLLVENLDRLSREDAGEATELFLSIVNKGVVIVQLSPAVMEFRRPVDMHKLMFAVVELSRGHCESAIKSERGRSSWARKQGEASTRIVTRKLPGWMKRDDNGMAVLDGQGRPVLDPERAKVVRRMFTLARDGYGATAIAKKLNDDGVPVMGRKEIAVRGQFGRHPAEREKRPVVWTGSVVWHVSRPGRPLANTSPTGDGGTRPVPPSRTTSRRSLTPETFHAVQGAIANRGRIGRGRRGTHVNLFAGLVAGRARRRNADLLAHGQTPPCPDFAERERGTRRGMGQFPGRVVRGGRPFATSRSEGGGHSGDNTAARKVEVIAGRLAKIDALVKLWSAKMDNPAIVDTVAAKLAGLNTEREEVGRGTGRRPAGRGEPAVRVVGRVPEFGRLAQEKHVR